MPVETFTADDFLFDRLSTDPVLIPLIPGGVHVDVAPETVEEYPYIVFNLQAPRDIRGVGPARIMADLLYTIKATTRGNSYLPLREIANRIDEILTAASGSAIGGNVLHVIREESIHFPETVNGVEYRHLGGLFRLYVQ